MTHAQADPARFIREHFRVEASATLPEIPLYTAHPASGLWRLTGRTGPPPYWAYRWAGGTVLARFLLDRPEIVRGKRVLDLGAGSGVVGIAAARAGAADVIAAELDPNAVAAIALNAALNGVTIATLCEDLLQAAPCDIDLVLVGDLFYSRALGKRVTAFLSLCVAAGQEVLVGDPGRAFLPHDRLTRLADLATPDFGTAKDGGVGRGAVFRFT